ncbi:MAG: GntR family transcriptional regulator [Propionicimonas sp.]
MLRDRCQSLPSGARLAGERALAEEFGVSAMTVRQSLAQLASEGWVRRAAGSGTYVSRPTVSMGPSLASFTEDMVRRGLTPHSALVRMEMIRPDAEIVARLELRAGESALLVERLRFADAEPMCHEISVFPPRLAEIIMDADMAGSLHKALAGHSVVPESTERMVRAIIASDQECSLLGLPRRSPALEMVDTFYDALHRPIQHVRSRYRFDRYEVLTVIHRAANPD